MGENGGSSDCSWLTVKEIQNYDWDRPLNVYVTAGEYRPWWLYDRNGRLSGISSRMISGERVIPEAEFQSQLKSGKAVADHGLFVQLGDGRHRDLFAASDITEAILPALLKIGPPDDVRIIFWFHY
jgi:hypothetical protein